LLPVGWERKAMKANELREMNDEQLVLTIKEASEEMFRLRLKSKTERNDSPSKIRHNRRLIARVQTIQRERDLTKLERGKAGA
jgi:large subunit ribosomal protein L29